MKLLSLASAICAMLIVPTISLGAATTAPAASAMAAATIHASDLGGVYNGKAFPATGNVYNAAGKIIAEPVFTYYLASDATLSHPLPGAPAAVGSYVFTAAFTGNSQYLPTVTSAAFRITAAPTPAAAPVIAPTTAPTTAPAAPATQVTLVTVTSGTEIAPLITAAAPYTTFVLSGNCTLSSTVHPPAYVRLTGGNLAVKPSPGAASIFDVSNPGFTLDHVVVSGTAASTLVFADAPNCTVDNVSADVLLNLVKSTSRATGLALTNSTVGESASEGVYIGGTADVTITGNAIGDSWGECGLRTDVEVDGAVVHIPSFVITGNTIGSHNAYGKQAVEIREGNGTLSGNTFNGAVRQGQTGPTPPLNVNTVGNTFADATGLPIGAPTNALQILGGVTGDVHGNLFGASACGLSPIAIAGGNLIRVYGNTSYGPMPLIPSSSPPTSYTLATVLNGLARNKLLNPLPQCSRRSSDGGMERWSDGERERRREGEKERARFFTLHSSLFILHLLPMLYFNNNDSGVQDCGNLNNYSQDSGNTVPAGALPGSGDDVTLNCDILTSSMGALTCQDLYLNGFSIGPSSGGATAVVITSVASINGGGSGAKWNTTTAYDGSPPLVAVGVSFLTDPGVNISASSGCSYTFSTSTTAISDDGSGYFYGGQYLALTYAGTLDNTHVIDPTSFGNVAVTGSITSTNVGFAAGGWTATAGVKPSVPAPATRGFPAHESN